MNDDPAGRKAETRRSLRERIAALSLADVEDASRLAWARLREQPEWGQARSVLLYYPMAREIDLRPALRDALRAGRLVALPRYCPGRAEYEAAVIKDEERDIRPGWAGIPEPAPECPRVPLNQLDLILVPGLGFTPDGWRIGRGKGYYDRLLGGVRGIRCGIAGEWQVIAAVPTQPHDERLDCLLTPKRWIVCRPRSV